MTLLVLRVIHKCMYDSSHSTSIEGHTCMTLLVLRVIHVHCTV